MKTIFKIIFTFLVCTNSIFSQNWEGFSTSVSESINRLYVDTLNELLYIGGPFRYVNGQEMKGITAWDGEEFYALSTGSDNCGNFNCNSINPNAMYKGELYCSVGGITHINGVLMNGACRWNGEEWNTVGSGLTYDNGSSGVGGQMLVYNDELYVTGIFHKAGNVNALGLAKWNGEQWYSLNIPQTIDSVSFFSTWSIALFNDEIYIGGNLSIAIDGVINNDIVKFNGSTLQTVANGSFKGNLGAINAIVVYKDELYIGGNIYKSEGNPGNGILKLQEDEWVDVGGSFDYSLYAVSDMLVYNDKLYVMGIFYSVGGGIPANNIATWDGEQWCSLGSEIDNKITTGAIFQDQLYIGGGFESIDNMNIDALARWTGGDYMDTCGAIVSIADGVIEKQNIELFPNPTNDKLYISVDGVVQNQFFNLSIYSLFGQQIYSQQNFRLNKEIDVSNLSSGTYILQLQYHKGVSTRKFVVQR